jgi:hypothetical protein
MSRAQCLVALLTRSQIEGELAGRASELKRWHGALDRLATWIGEEELAASFTDVERALFAQPVSAWAPADTSAVAWRIEALAVFMWAAGKLDTAPNAPQPMDADDVFATFPLLGARSEFLEDAAPRDDEELDRGRRAVGVWRWRARTELLHRSGATPASGDAYDEMVSRAARKAFDARLVDALVEGDFGVGQRAFSELTDTELRGLAAALLERQHALDWLCDENADWDDESSEL